MSDPSIATKTGKAAHPVAASSPTRLPRSRRPIAPAHTTVAAPTAQPTSW